MKKRLLTTWLMLMIALFAYFEFRGGIDWREHAAFLPVFAVLILMAAFAMHQPEIMRAWSLSRQRKGKSRIVRPYVLIDIAASLDDVTSVLKQIAESQPSFKKFEVDDNGVLVFRTRMNWRSFGERATFFLEGHGRRSVRLHAATMPVQEAALFDGGRSFRLLTDIVAAIASAFPGKVSVGEYKLFDDAKKELAR